ncbi:MAG: hypothetical protein ACOCU2_00015 [Bacillota bacterium]
MTKDEIVNKINQFLEYDITDRLYEKKVTSYVGEICTEKDFDKHLRDIMDDKHYPLDVRFTAFFIIFTFLRRKQNYNALKELMQKHINKFKPIPLLDHIQLLYGATNPFNNNSWEDLIDTSTKLINQHDFANHVGVLHHHARLYAEYYEYNLDKISEDDAKKALEKAYEVAHKVTELEPSYGKFYATLGRIAAINKNFTVAFNAFHKAMKLEDPSSESYDARMTEYALYQNNVYTLKRHFEIEKLYASLNEKEHTLDAKIKGHDTLINEHKEANFRNLGLFAGLITFVLGNITILSNANDNIPLIMIMFSAVFFLYFGFLLIISSLNANTESTNIYRSIFRVSILISLIGLGLLVFTLIETL